MAMYCDSFGWHTRQEYEDFARVRLRRQAVAGLPGLARGARVPHGHLDTLQSRRGRLGLRRVRQPDQSPAHRHEPYGLAALLTD